jgi:hypothetical protein
MDEPFLTFRKFNDPEIASEMAAKLKEHNIEVELEDDGKLFDPSFAKNFLDRDIRLKLRAKDFEQADKVMRFFYSRQAGRQSGSGLLPVSVLGLRIDGNRPQSG